MGVGHALEHRHAQRRDVIGRRNQIGHHYGAHTRGMRRPNPRHRIFERHAMNRIDLEPPRRRQVGFGGVLV